MIYNRQYQESLEEKFLAPYAIRSKLSKGRKYHETEPDYRFSLITKVITTALG
jgi:hypothetical protein